MGGGSRSFILARLELASRHPTNRLAALRGNPALTSDQNALRAWGHKNFGAFAPCKRFAQQNLGGGRIHFARAFQFPERNPKKEVTTYVVTSFFGAGDEARSRHCRAATRTAGDKRPTGAFSRFARALFDPLPAGAKKSALLRRTSVLRSKTLAEGEFTSPEHLNFLPESKKRSHNIRCDFFFWSGRRGSNSLPPPWQGGALPDELRPRNKMYYTRHFSLCQA